MTLRAVAKTIAYQSGALDLFHRARHGECLTVLMFHRVLPRAEIDRSGADPLYAVTPELLADIVEFLKHNYAIIGMRDILQSLQREKPLPQRPVLITFDDGWRDNLQWALPVLRGLPWMVFVASDALSGQDYWWQEVILWTLRAKRASFTELWDSVAPGEAATNPAIRQDALALLLKYGSLSPEHRRALLAEHEDVLRSRSDPRHMLTAEELARLKAQGVEIGSHGASHLPLSHIEDPANDLQRSTRWLASFGGLPAMSFPHGRYDAKTLEAARRLGYSAIFTSDAILNPCPHGWLQSDRIGRISLEAAGVSDARGTLSPARLAAQLYLRDIGMTAEQAA